VIRNRPGNTVAAMDRSLFALLYTLVLTNLAIVWVAVNYTG
jgi:hypothetical protein